MLRLQRLSKALVCVCALTACQTSPSETTASVQQAQTGTTTHQLAWGPNEGDMRVQQPGFEQVAQGPSAVAVAGDGAVLILDRLGGRVARVGLDGSVRTLAAVPVDAEDLAVGPDGAFAALSMLRATAWIHDSSGAPAGEVKLPRELRELVSVELGGRRPRLARARPKRQSRAARRQASGRPAALERVDAPSPCGGR